MDSSLSLAEQPAKPNADIMPAKPALHRMRLAAAVLFAAVQESGVGTKRTFFDRAQQCPLLGVKRTSQIRLVMSASDPKRTFGPEDCCYAK
jgi:hypothetical protein